MDLFIDALRCAISCVDKGFVLVVPCPRSLSVSPTCKLLHVQGIKFGSCLHCKKYICYFTAKVQAAETPDTLLFS